MFGINGRTLRENVTAFLNVLYMSETTYLAQLFSLEMWHEHTQRVKTSIDALHPSPLITVGYLSA